MFSGDYFAREFSANRDPQLPLPESLANGDGDHYKEIAEHGYDYMPGHASTVAFFPVYPVVASALVWATGLGVATALVIVSNGCCLVAFVLMGMYLQVRPHPESAPSTQAGRLANGTGDDCIPGYELFVMGLMPTTFFFRMAYAESMFLCAAILAMYGIVRSWSFPTVAFLVGLATAIRPVGVALLLPLVWYIGQASNSKREVVVRIAYAVPLGCWGLIVYMAYQYWQFGEPIAFALTQESWSLRPPGMLGDKALSLLSLQPIWNVYLPRTAGYWNRGGAENPIFSLQFANPICFVGTAILIGVGAWKRWLNIYEVLLSLGLLGIPYVTRAYEMCMLSQGRFAAVVFPAYIVMGHLLARMPKIVALSLLALSGVLMAIYAALFAAGYSLI